MPPEEAFDGRLAFADALRLALDRAATEGWSELTLCDPDFSDWPLGERAVTESLNAWAQSGRRCVLLAHHFDDVVRRHARFVQWRQTWSHRVEAYAWREAEPEHMLSCVVGPAWALHCIDLKWRRGVCIDAPQRLLQLREAIAERLDRARPAFAATTLGL